MSDSDQFFPFFQDPFSQQYQPPKQSTPIVGIQEDVYSNKSLSQQSQSQKSKNTKRQKTKIISKQKKNQKQQQFDSRSFQNIPKGRRKNTILQVNHLIQNQSYNDIIYHYCRFIYFATYLTKSNISKQVVSEPTQQSQWIDYISFVMSIDNYPSLSQEKPNFLLHSNTPHFLFQYLIKNQSKYIYSSAQMRDIILFTLNKRGFSSQVINYYILPYWNDIITLINNTQQERQENLQNQTHRQKIDDLKTQCKSRKSKPQNFSPQFLVSKPEKQKSERESLNYEIQADQSAIAYEIACYLHSCCEKYSIKIAL